MSDLVLEVIIEYLFQYPGAFIRWVFLYRKRSFQYLLDNSPLINTVVTILLIISIVSIIAIV